MHSCAVHVFVRCVATNGARRGGASRGASTSPGDRVVQQTHLVTESFWTHLLLFNETESPNHTARTCYVPVLNCSHARTHAIFKWSNDQQKLRLLTRSVTLWFSLCMLKIHISSLHKEKNVHAMRLPPAPSFNRKMLVRASHRAESTSESLPRKYSSGEQIHTTGPEAEHEVTTSRPARKPWGEVQRTFTTELTRSGHQTQRASRTPNTHEQSLIRGRPWPRHPRKDVDQCATHRDLTVSACHSPQSWRNALVCLFTPLDNKLINIPSSNPQPECDPERNAVRPEPSANKATIWNTCPSESERDRKRQTSSLQRRSVQPSLAIALESPILQERSCGCVHISPSSVPILDPVCKDSFACAHCVCVVLRLTELSKFQPRTW